MSHITEIKAEIKNLDSLKKACEGLGLEFVEGKTKYKWFGTLVGGGQVFPVGFDKSDAGKCEHVIRVKGAKASTYEVGVVSRRDGKPGYHLLWDNWQGGYGLQKVIGENAGRLIQHYQVEEAAKALMKKGFRINRKTLDNGNMILETR